MQQEWQWSERATPQPEILAYCQHVAERFDLRKDMEFHTRVASAHFDEGEKRWAVTAEDGRRWDAQFAVMATGCLSMPNVPDVAGADGYTAHLPSGAMAKDGVDFTGKRAVIGTGSSAIQSIPLIAAQAKSMTVFQRTPNHSVPAQNKPFGPILRRPLKPITPIFGPATLRSLLGSERAIPLTRAPCRESSPRSAKRSSNTTGRQEASSSCEPSAIRASAPRPTSRGGSFAARSRSKKDPENGAEAPSRYGRRLKRLCADSGYFETFNEPRPARGSGNAAQGTLR